MVWNDTRLCKIPWEKVSAALNWDNPAAAPTPACESWMRRHSHQHSYDELVVCLSGDHGYGLKSQVVSLSPGGALLIKKHISHDATYSVHHKACVDFWMHFLPGGSVAMKLVDHHPKRGLKLLPIPCPQGSLLCDFRRAGELVTQADGRGISARKAKKFLGYVLLSVFEKLEEGGYRTASNDEGALIESIKLYASRNLGDRLTLAELARVAGYSPFHFHRMFLRMEGVTPRNFVLTKRLDYACKLLKQGLSITSAALDAGFTDSSQFARTFKQHFNETPGRWLASQARS